MKPSTTLKLFIAVCLLGIVIWIMEKSVETTDEKKDRSSRILNMNADEITGLYIERGDLKIDCVKIDGRWQITNPISAMADESQIERIISRLERMPCSEVITPSQRIDRALGLGDYGLLFPESRFIVRTPLDTREILIGKESPLGGLVYLKLKSSSDVIGTDRVIIDAVPESVTQLRERILLHGDASRTSRVEIHRRNGGFVQLARSGGKWRLEQPVKARADEGNIVQLLDVLYSLNVVDFVWDPPAYAVKPVKIEGDPKSDSTARAELHGLTEVECAARIMVWTEGDEVGKELILGKTPEGKADEIYVKCRDRDSVYTVNSGMLNLLIVPINELRDRNVFALDPKNINYFCFTAGDRKLVLEKNVTTGWQITEPVRWAADHLMVESVIDELARLTAGSFVDVPYTNLAVYGLAKPICSVHLSSGAPVKVEEKPEPSTGKERPASLVPAGCIYVGRKPEEKTDRFYVLQDDIGQPENPENAVVTLAAVFSPAIQRAINASVDPLAYRDRTVLTVSPTSIKKISLYKNGLEHSVVRLEGDKWQSEGIVSNKVNSMAVADILFHMANLRAVRIEEHNPKSLTSYGLDSFETKLTLGLDGSEGIQKSLIFGFRSKADGVFAMVQGQDVVFVLKNDTVGQLTADIIQTLPPENNQTGSASTGGNSLND